jgi:carbamoyl-phosphate synthase (glutamine-hydrolyzing)
MAGRALAAEVSARQRYVVEPSGRFEGCEPVAVVAAIDLGIKARTPWQLAERGVRVHVLPQTTTFEEVLALHPDGVFFSNGPGDPGTAHSEVELLRGVLDARIPFFGICLGNQIFGRALGYGTYKLSYGHRGINQPVLDRAAGRVEITAHNHGFAVDAPIGEPSLAPYDGGRYGRVEVSHVGLNDHVVEGLRALDVPAFSVQFHPEAAAGPHDGEHLFDRFVRLMADHRHRRDGAAARTIQEER